MLSKGTSSRTGNVSRVFDLDRDATLALPRSRRGVSLRVRYGTLIVTQAGDPEDHVVAAGEALTLPPGGLAVAWALRPTVLTVRDVEGSGFAEPLRPAA